MCSGFQTYARYECGVLQFTPVPLSLRFFLIENSLRPMSASLPRIPNFKRLGLAEAETSSFMLLENEHESD
jgi:hypothetical protein